MSRLSPWPDGYLQLRGRVVDVLIGLTLRLARRYEAWLTRGGALGNASPELEAFEHALRHARGKRQTHFGVVVRPVAAGDADDPIDVDSDDDSDDDAAVDIDVDDPMDTVAEAPRARKRLRSTGDFEEDEEATSKRARVMLRSPTAVAVMNLPPIDLIGSLPPEMATEIVAAVWEMAAFDSQMEIALHQLRRLSRYWKSLLDAFMESLHNGRIVGIGLRTLRALARSVMRFVAEPVRIIEGAPELALGATTVFRMFPDLLEGTLFFAGLNGLDMSPAFLTDRDGDDYLVRPIVKDPISPQTLAAVRQDYQMGAWTRAFLQSGRLSPLSSDQVEWLRTSELALHVYRTLALHVPDIAAVFLFLYNTELEGRIDVMLAELLAACTVTAMSDAQWDSVLKVVRAAPRFQRMGDILGMMTSVFLLNSNTYFRYAAPNVHGDHIAMQARLLFSLPGGLRTIETRIAQLTMAIDDDGIRATFQWQHDDDRIRCIIGHVNTRDADCDLDVSLERLACAWLFAHRYYVHADFVRFIGAATWDLVMVDTGQKHVIAPNDNRYIEVFDVLNERVSMLLGDAEEWKAIDTALRVFIDILPLYRHLCPVQTHEHADFLVWQLEQRGELEQFECGDHERNDPDGHLAAALAAARGPHVDVEGLFQLAVSEEKRVDFEPGSDDEDLRGA